MPGPILIGYKRQGPNSQGAGQIINNHTNKKTVSPDNTMLGVHGQLPDMVILQSCQRHGAISRRHFDAKMFGKTQPLQGSCMAGEG